MATRAPSSFTAYVDQSALVPRSQILFTGPDQIADDQQFCLDVENVIISTRFYAEATTSGSYADLSVLKAKNRDLCGVAATETVTWYCYCWRTVDDGDFSIRLGQGAATDAQTITTTRTTPAWRGPYTLGSTSSDGTIDTWTLSAKRDAGTGSVLVGGLFVVSG